MHPNGEASGAMHPVVEQTHREFFDNCGDNVEAFALTPEFLANWKEDVDAANWNPDTIISAFWAQVDYQKVCDPTNHDPSLYHGDSEIVAFYKMIFLCQ